MTRDLGGTVAIVSGAGRGIGRAIAEDLAAAGVEVVVVARSESDVHEVAQGIRSRDGRAVAVAADVSTQGGVESVASAVPATPLIVVNAAGMFGPLSPVVDASPAEWMQTIEVNLFSTYLLSRRFLPGMLAAGWGRILNVTSAASLHAPGPLNSAYATSKVAVNQFTRHLASEIDGTGVTANVFHPGDVKTAMFEDIKSRVRDAGDGAAGNLGAWVEWLERTGGDSPRKAVDLVMRIVTDDGPGPNGEFLWIDDPLQPRIASWETVGPPPSYGRDVLRDGGELPDG